MFTVNCIDHCSFETRDTTNVQRTLHTGCGFNRCIDFQLYQRPRLPFCLESICAVPATICVCVLSDGVTGELKISNHSQSFAGIYLCEVNNAVGAESCRIILRANKRKGMQIEYSCPHILHMTHTHKRERPRFHPFLSL